MKRLKSIRINDRETVPGAKKDSGSTNFSGAKKDSGTSVCVSGESANSAESSSYVSRLPPPTGIDDRLGDVSVGPESAPDGKQVAFGPANPPQEPQHNHFFRGSCET
ncbi:unnamed protein product [Caenorhabditis auriculariae]|uniref:Uncharacterized protein n=1 Tax=Caenorhabditis auriculariae TaxID=2777116 RepID=A0A8S1HPV9_9PELO|nr:unnamed protein product [Caenorhabditis auriculariae]